MKNFIWDFDGTLFDTYTHTVTILHRYMAELGRPLDYAQLYSVCRNHIGKAMELCGASGEEWQEFFRREADITAAPVARPYEGTGEMLAAVTAAGGANFLYTHRNAIALKYLREYGYMKYFTGYVTMENGFAPKPAPDAILYLIDKFGLDPAETVMIGDREIDVLSGVNAGVHACLFTDGYRNAETAQNTKAEWVAENMSALQKLFIETVL